MKKQILYALVVAAMFSLTAIMIIAGCGGSGGPIKPPETGPGPSVNAQFLALLPDAQKGAAYVGSDKCSPCHSGDAHFKIQENWMQTRHAQVNVGCEQCHGPGSVHVASRAPSRGASVQLASIKTRAVANDILTYPYVVEPVVCGQCHGPTFDQFMQSPHAAIVQSPAKGGSATCMRCHSDKVGVQMVDSRLTYKGFHESTILEIDTNIVNAFKDANQKNAWIAATNHTATCVSCHTPHQNTQYLASGGQQRRLRRQNSIHELQNRDETTNALFTKGVEPQDPAAPAYYTTFNQTCARCHNGRGANGNDSVLVKQNQSSRPNMHDSPQYNMLYGIGGAHGTGPGPIVSRGSHFDVPDQCVHCHMPNRRHTFTVSFDTSCQPCHTTADAATRASVTKNEILNGLFALRSRMESWAQSVFGNSDFWEYPALLTEEGVTTLPNQAQVPLEVRRARHNYYFIIRDKSFGIHNLVYARFLLTQANAELDSIGVSRAAKQSSRSAFESILNRDLLKAKRAEVHAPDSRM